MVPPDLIVLQVVALISILSSSAVILTLFFKGLREKLFMRIIAFISISDLMANAPYASIRRPNDNTPLCTLEAFMNIYFYPAGWLWTTMLMLLLYSLATRGTLPFSIVFLHVLCWGFPLFLALLNFAFGSSQSQQAPFAFDICLLGSSTEDIFIYHSVSYYGLFITCIVSMAAMYYKITKIDNLEIKSKFPSWKAAKDTLQLYPLALLICWTPHLISVLAAYFSPFTGLNDFYFAADILKILHGSVTAIIFFSKSGEARSKWKRLFLRIFNTFRVMLGQKQIDLIQSKVVDFSVEYEVRDSDNNSLRRSSLMRNSFVDDYKVDISAVQVDGSIVNITTNNRMHSENEREESYVEIC